MPLFSPRLLLTVCAAALFPMAATAQSPARPPQMSAPAAAPADPALEAAEQAFLALDENTRRAILDALMWTGDYNGVVGVNFGKRGYDGIRAFQRKRNIPQTGILDDGQRLALLADGRKARDSVRFSMISETRSGMKIGVPQRVMETSQPIESGALKGVRYRSQDGAMALDIAGWPASVQTLEQFLAQGLERKPNRKVTYKLQRPDFIVMSGEDNGRTFYTRAALQGDMVRGFTFSYPAARKGDFERVMLAIANSFDPFPGQTVAQPASAPASVPAAARPAGTFAGTSAAPLSAAPRSRIAGVGMVTAPGRVLTSASVLDARCLLTVRGAAVQADAPANGLVTLNVAGLNAPAAVLTRAGMSPQDGDALMALGMDGNAATLVSGHASGTNPLRFTGGLGDGAAGAPVFNMQGQVAGFVRDMPKPLAVASLGGPVARSHGLIAPAGLGAAAGLSAPVSAGTIAARYAPSIVPIICAP